MFCLEDLDLIGCLSTIESVAGLRKVSATILASDMNG